MEKIEGPKKKQSERRKNNEQLFLEPEWAMSQQPMRPKAKWAIDSEAMRARGIIVLVNSNQLVKKISTLNIFRE